MGTVSPDSNTETVGAYTLGPVGDTKRTVFLFSGISTRTKQKRFQLTAIKYKSNLLR